MASFVISNCHLQSGGGEKKQHLWFILYSMIKYRTIVWNEGQRSIPLEWVSCLYKVVRSCAESANSTHPSWRSDAQMEPKCDLNYSPLFRAKVIKRGNNFFFKNRTHIRVFSLLLSHSPGKRGFLWSGNQTFPITSASLLCNLRGNQIWYRDNRGERRGWHLSWHRPLGTSIGARESLTSATWEKWSRPEDS